ncbi:MAG: sigma-70 family RNA polymerase sigma factor [Clostridia bacterium]|nr:sigma-70 family RNA polymerase sigma factor [Clostridia bacterium]
MNDAAIIDLYFKRDEQALTLTEEKYGQKLRGIAFGILSDRMMAEECENDTYLRAWNAIPPASPKEHFFAFLAKIIRRLSINRLRDGARQKRNADLVALTAELELCLPCGEDVEGTVDEKLLMKSISDFIKALPKEQRLVFVRRYWYLDSVEQIASRLGIGQSKVKSILSRGRKRLKEHLEKEGFSV